MNKEQLIAAVAEKQGTTKAEAERNVGDVIGIIMKGASTDGECAIPNLGKLKANDKPATSGESFGKAWSKPAYRKFSLTVGAAGDKFLA